MRSRLSPWSTPAFFLAALTVLIAALTVQAATPAGEALEQPEAEPTFAVVMLDEVAGSGFQGMAVLRGTNNETEAVIAVAPPDGLLPAVPPTADDIGNAAVLWGMCGELGYVVYPMDELQPVAEGDEVRAMQGVIPVPLDELLNMGGTIAVLDRSVDPHDPGRAPRLPEGAPAPTPSPDVTPPGATPPPLVPPQQLDPLVCGRLTPEALLAPPAGE